MPTPLRSRIHVRVQTPPSAPPLQNSTTPSLQSSGTPLLQSSSAILDFVASDETLDRYQEIITADGWKLDNYLLNPVFQNSHQYGDIIFTLGKALVTDIREVPLAANAAAPQSGRKALFQRIEFAVDANPMARIAYSLYRGGFLNTVSVGFMPLRWQDANAATHPNADPSSAGQTESATFRRRYLEQELLEVSAVAIPANPNALVLGLKSGALARSDLQDTLDLLHQTLRSTAPRTATVPSRSTSFPNQPPCTTHSQLFTLALELRSILRS